MGEPGRSNVLSPFTEHIGKRSDTQGSETSQYLQEKKSIEIAQVVASERAFSPNREVYFPGLRDFNKAKQFLVQGVGKLRHRA